MSPMTTSEAIKKLESMVELHARYMDNCLLLEEPVIAAAAAKAQHRNIQALEMAIDALKKEID